MNIREMVSSETSKGPATDCTGEIQAAIDRWIWRLVEQHPGTVEAIHSTYHPSHRIGCVIEQRCFTARQSAMEFTRHLLSSGWCIQDLHEAGEHFWFRLTEALR